MFHVDGLIGAISHNLDLKVKETPLVKGWHYLQVSPLKNETTVVPESECQLVCIICFRREKNNSAPKCWGKTHLGVGKSSPTPQKIQLIRNSFLGQSSPPNIFKSFCQVSFAARGKASV